jgi:drug/metabolite transporter (DMT)-like permease
MALAVLSRRPLAQAALCVALAEALLTFMDALMKGLSSRYPTFEIAFLRFAFGSLWATALLIAFRPGWPSVETVQANLSRSFLVVITATCFFYALGQLPLAETVALSFVSPLLMALFGAWFLDEKLDRSIGIALASGFSGMLLIMSARLGQSAYETGALLGLAAALVSTVTYALNIIVLRTRAQRDPALTIVWFQSAAPAVMLLLPALAVWTQPSASDLALFTLVGALAVAGHYLLALAFARASASRLAPLHYTTLVWGIAFGYLMFAEVPTLTTIAGATLIAAGALIAQRKPVST